MPLAVGEKVQGKVTGITNFGAFIGLEENKTGLVHISEVSDKYVSDIKDVLTVGQEVTVKVVSIADDGKIGLSIRKAIDKPAYEKKEYPKSQQGDAPHTRPSRPQASRPDNNNRGGQKPNSRFQNNNNNANSNDFDSLMSAFLKDSDDRLTSLKRNTEGKRGGRGGRRS